MKPCSVPTYAALRDKVRETLLLGMRRIEEARVRAYWQTGRYVQEHIFFQKGKADYGKRTVWRLAEELGIDSGELWRMVKFAQKFPILGRGLLLTWSHYRVLITIPDEKKMLALADRASKEEWTRDKLRKMIRLERSFQPMQLKSVRLLEVPKLGLLNTYQIKAAGDVGWSEKDVLLLDHGFRSFLALTQKESQGLKAGDVVEWTGTKLLKNGRTAKDLYTYKAYLEKVIDADSYWVALDTGLRGVGHQKLRLRGIDCPEIDTPEGKAAKKFVESVLRDVPYLIVLSHKNDNHDRYEADVFFDNKHGKQVYLNNLLLEKGHAVRTKE
ncbi:MAG: DUF1016 N-terminal domain-containing protein [Candidatus Omnitrophota bacterium]